MRSQVFRSMCLIAIGLAMMTGCNRENTPPKVNSQNSESPGITLPAEAVRMSGIRRERVQIKTFSVSVKATGTITFNKQRYVCLSARVPGRVEQVNAFEGDRVRAGQSLAALYSADYLSAQQDLIQLLRQEEREQKGASQDASTLAGLLVRSALQKLKLMGVEDRDIQEIKETKSPQYLLAVKAPFAGTIVSAKVTPGQQVEGGADLFDLADLDTLWVTARIQEKDLSLVKPGSAASITVQAWPGDIFPGRLTAIGDIEDEGTRTIQGRIETVNPQRKLKLGMFAEVTLTSPETVRILAIPETSVREIEGRTVVFQPGPNDTFVPRTIKSGRRIEGWVEVLDGLKEGEEIVTEGSFALKAEALKKTLEGEE
jgi:RND family efflux transporter MFP subunit